MCHNGLLTPIKDKKVKYGIKNAPPPFLYAMYGNLTQSVRGKYFKNFKKKPFWKNHFYMFIFFLFINFNETTLNAATPSSIGREFRCIERSSK